MVVYIVLASQRLRPARSILASRDSLVHSVQVSCNFTMYMSWQDDATSEHPPELRPAVPNSATGVSAEPLFCFRQLLAWLGRASRARSARPFTATLPSTPHYHTRRLTSIGASWMWNQSLIFVLELMHAGTGSEIGRAHV